MATTTSITTTYAGQFSGKYIAAALLSAPTLDKEYITIKPNIKYKEVVKTLAQTGIIVDEFGNKKEDPKSDEPKSLATIFHKDPASNKSGKIFTPINSYKPQGNLIYNEDLLNKLDNKLN